MAIFFEANMGVEREALRVDFNGKLSQKPFPEMLGDKINNPLFTVDFSESQLEIVTPVMKNPSELYGQLENQTDYAMSSLDNEYLWPFSMPSKLPSENKIPLAKFPKPEHHLKELYRKGLAVRYGKPMQMISGIHFNFSFTNEQISYLLENYGFRDSDDIYLSTARNFLRNRWLYLLLNGASPVAGKDYIKYLSPRIQALEPCCGMKLKPEHLTKTVSLRMSQFGYNGSYPGPEGLSFNNLEEYLEMIRFGLSTCSKEFSKIGLCCKKEAIQINSNYLQTEGECYSPIRLKGKHGENQLKSLTENGIDYLEIRSIDVNPFDRAGISEEQLYFTHIFLLNSLMQESPMLTKKERVAIAKRDDDISLWGRAEPFMGDIDPISGLNQYDEGLVIFKQLFDIAEKLSENRKYLNAVNMFYEMYTNPENLISAKLMKLYEEEGKSYIESGLDIAQKNRVKELMYV